MENSVPKFEKKKGRITVQASLNTEEQELFFHNREARGFNENSAFVKAAVLGIPYVKRKADHDEQLVIRALDQCSKILPEINDDIIKTRLEFVINALHALAPNLNV